MDALIWAGGEYQGGLPEPSGYWSLPPSTAPVGWALVVAADSGARHAIRLGCRLDALLGDFDSLDPKLRAALFDVPQFTFPVAKDATDAELAVRHCRERGATRILIAGGVGSRFDQSLAAAQLLLPLQSANALGCVSDGRQRIYGLTRGSIQLPTAPGDIVSLLPQAPQVSSVRTEGLRWALAGDTLHLGESRSVSNEAVARTIRVDTGGPLLITVHPPG